jgi:NAD dependent epimerase/dehydratase
MAQLSLRGRKILVTGAGGFIGSHLVDRLVSDGALVRVFLRYNSRSNRGLLEMTSPKIMEHVEVIFGDLRDPEAVCGAMRGIETVFHLGALIAIPYSYMNPREVTETNVMGTLNILMAARQTLPGRILHTSTSEVYGTALKVPIDENHPIQAQSPYSASKIAADKISESFFRSFEVPVVTVRPFNTYGPRQSARAIIPTIVSQALSGGDLRLGDLKPVRDFNYVTDTVDGFVRAALADGVEGETFNLGSGLAISISELVEMIRKLTGYSGRILEDKARIRPEKSEVQLLKADSKKASQLLGWHPQTSHEEGLMKTIAWIKENPMFFQSQRYAV